MKTCYLKAALDTKPDILQIIGRYTSLKKVGREFLGFSPCHNDQHPSLRVNVEKQVWYCDPCSIGGDVIRFIELVENASFKEALSILAMADEPKPRPITARQREAAELAAAWMAEQRRKINVLLGEVLEQIELADEIGDGELAESFLRKQSFLRDLYEDLDMSRNAASLIAVRPTIEALTEGVDL